MILTQIRYRHLWRRGYVRVLPGAECDIDRSARIIRSRIILAPGAKLRIGSGCIISSADIYVGKGELLIGRNTLIKSASQTQYIIINDGRVVIGDHSRIDTQRIWVRFGGRLSIGSYTNINYGSEIRCDEQVDIGSYNQISYNVRIWDTNTHNILPVEERRALTREHFPYFGLEVNRPTTSPVYIGDDCWIGESAAILKGSCINSGAAVGFRTTIAGKEVPSGATVVNSSELKIFRHE